MKCLSSDKSHLSISPLHHSNGCSGSHCEGQQHSVSNWTRVRNTGHGATRSLLCLHRILNHEGQFRLSRSPAPGTPRQPPVGPSHGRKLFPTGRGEAPQLCQSTYSPHSLVWLHLWIGDKITQDTESAQTAEDAAGLFKCQAYQKQQLHPTEHPRGLWGNYKHWIIIISDQNPN